MNFFTGHWWQMPGTGRAIQDLWQLPKEGVTILQDIAQRVVIPIEFAHQKNLLADDQLRKNFILLSIMSGSLVLSHNSASSSIV